MATSPDRAGRYRVVFENGEVMRLYRQTVEDFCLYAGQELSDQQLQELHTAAGAMSAKMRAVRIVTASNVSRRDLEQRLVRKGEDPMQAREAVQWMADMSLLDDKRTAEQIVSRCISKGYGLARAKQALYEKRIPKELWDEVLEDYPEQTEKIMDFLNARLGEDPSDRDVKRAIEALLRRGHSYAQIRRAMAQLTVDDQEFTEE